VLETEAGFLAARHSFAGPHERSTLRRRRPVRVFLGLDVDALRRRQAEAGQRHVDGDVRDDYDEALGGAVSSARRRDRAVRERVSGEHSRLAGEHERRADAFISER
jgi:hypothetical protein